MIEKIGVTRVRKTGINDLIVCILFCVFALSPAFCCFPVNRTQEAEKHFRLASSICMPLDHLVSSYKGTNCNKKALKSAQQILNKETKNPSSPVSAIRNEMRQLTEISQTKKVVPALESQTNIEPLTTEQQTWREKFSDIAPKAFAPP
ncbi:MAG: hypothetical protein LBK58_16410 [Prevotellaceae bacterium]|nr:hypothetical protein [Prevotellaceae bacterium]